MVYKYGDRIVVSNNDLFAPTGKATVVGTDRIFGETAIIYLLDNDKIKVMPDVPVGFDSHYYAVGEDYVTPLDNED